MSTLKDMIDQGGMSLIELSAAMAISAIILVPLTSIIAVQVRTPVKLVSEITAKRQLQKASLMITQDAAAAETFEMGTEPLDHGTFFWEELSGGDPVPVSVRYFFEPVIDKDSKIESGIVLREVIRGGQGQPSKTWIVGITRYQDVVFEYTAPEWTFGGLSRDWTLGDGKIEVTVTQTLEAGAKFDATVTTEKIIAHLRPDITRPVIQPSP